jgi:solute carrier family 25 (peroxisomal adenine nucleotide transporter), member 17
MAQEGEETIVSEVLSASLGGAISASILYPLEVLKTKMQAADDGGHDDNDESSCHEFGDNHDDDEIGNKKDKDKSKQKLVSAGMVQTALQLYEHQGISVFVRGIETSALQSAIEKALYFFAYTALKQGYSSALSSTTRSMKDGKQKQHSDSSSSNNIGAFANLMLGCAAEWMHLPISLPIDAWTTQIQTSTTGAAPMQILLTMLASPNKMNSWYKGLSAYYVLCFKPALQYTVYEQVKKLLVAHRRDKTLSAVEAFLLGMVARTVATVLVFPCVRAKVLLQKQAAVSANASSMMADPEPAFDSTRAAAAATTPPAGAKVVKEELTTIKVLLRTLQRQGLAGLYQGLGPELTRGIFSAALMLMIKERIAGTVRKALS